MQLQRFNNMCTVIDVIDSTDYFIGDKVFFIKETKLLLACSFLAVF